LGFDATDDVLDIEIRPNREWRWKDDDELEEAVKATLLTAEEADAIRSEGGRVIERMNGRNEPFTTDWTAWRPDERWAVPELPKGWDAVRATS
jgi:predicted RNA-binding protein associated with RNAse of E/G family